MRRPRRRPSLDQLLVVALDHVVVALGSHRALLLHRLEQVLAEPLGRAVLVGARDPDRLVAERTLLGLAGGAARTVARPCERVRGGAGRGARAPRGPDPPPPLRPRPLGHRPPPPLSPPR